MSAKSAIIKFGYNDHRVFVATNGKKKHSAVCKFCTTTITEISGVTSGFTRHMKLHEYKYAEYLKCGKVFTREDDQYNNRSFDAPGAGYTGSSHSYSATHPRQKVTNEEVVKDLIVGCCLPIPNTHSQNFIKLEPRSPSNVVASEDGGEEDYCWVSLNSNKGDGDSQVGENQMSGQAEKQTEEYYPQATLSHLPPSAPSFSGNAPVARYKRKPENEQAEKEHNSPSTSAHLILPSSPSSLTDAPAGRRKRKADEVDHVDQLMLSLLSSAQRTQSALLGQIAQPSTSDEASLVGEMVAVTLRRLSPYKRAMAKVKIQQLLFDIEFGEQQKV